MAESKGFNYPQRSRCHPFRLVHTINRSVVEHPSSRSDPIYVHLSQSVLSGEVLYSVLQSGLSYTSPTSRNTASLAQEGFYSRSMAPSHWNACENLFMSIKNHFVGSWNAGLSGSEGKQLTNPNFPAANPTFVSVLEDARPTSNGKPREMCNIFSSSQHPGIIPHALKRFSANLEAMC
ncbi:hypothetical protein K402DRAFT_110925 [Aulographum hederae CBS 113979]|uniref:Uncharacterized protein n=1 Tax=Aulographum hederae CBS 113979 TaxID=1176131 RepID=A0A6G1GW19_9PEZI|nr:hypothetical protein K402DRAFT_110925 [Aulographum hederae CBS 113979]